MTHGCVVYDLDGTLASNAWRQRIVDTQPRHWAVFFLLGALDAPIPNTVAMLHADHAAGHRILVVTGRPRQYETLVRAWLDRHGLLIDELWMRDTDDFRIDAVVKAEIADRMIAQSGHPMKVVEDRRELDRVWAARGIRVVRVADPGLKPDDELLAERLMPEP